jgi:D-beta-D-heptose 7-phosphate kinase / D-beta-D-heptose 1-phosphate adenosyltransferase
MIEHLSELIQAVEHRWPERRILIVGDVILDKYIWGEVQRISPEAPVPIVRTTHQSNQPGGAANVALNITKLGGQSVLVGFTGGDEDEVLLTQSLRANGISSSFVISSGFPTITKLRILGGRQQMLRLDTERLGTRKQEDYARLLELVFEQLPQCHAVVLSDYAKGTLPPDVCQAIIQRARELGIPVLVDPKAADFSRYHGATTICPNLGELSAATGVSTSDLKTVLDAAEAMVTPLDLKFLTVTLSEKGIALVRPGKSFVDPAHARQVFDVSGAGDTVIAVLALCVASNLQPESSIQLANLAAGVVVGKVGTVPVERHQLLAALSPEIALHAENKVVAVSELLTRVAQWKSNGEHVVFTNGCFDLLHIGHITLLEQSRRFGDRLIVAINSDDSVSRLKGPGRPIVRANERARVLAALSAVDAVVIFDSPTPLELIVSARPDVIVKGGDYDLDSVVGSREVQSWGGQVRIVPTVEGFSTTGLIAKGSK